MTTLLQDLRYGLRMLAKSPGVTAVAVMALALGIGANTSIFTVVNALLLHPFPFKQLDRLVAVWETAPKQNEDHISPAPANFRDWREQNHSFQELAAGHGWEVNLTGTGNPERVDGYQVTPEFFPMLGMRAEQGRTLSAEDFEPGHTSVVVVSYGFWQQRLGAKQDVIGTRVHLNGQEFTLVGVMPQDFEYPMGVEVWGPLDFGATGYANRTDHYLQVAGRLKPGVSLAQAQADLQTISARLAQQFPQSNAGHGVRTVILVNEALQGSRQFILVLMGAAGFVLLLACANVANLLLARGSARRKEIAVRLALGASPRRIARQLLIESVLQSLLGAAVGTALAYADMERQRGSIPAWVMKYVPGIRHQQIDGYVLAFTIAIAVGAGILAGLAFAWHASREDLNEGLKESSRGAGAGSSSHRVRGLLVVTEIALALVLLTGAGLMVKGFEHLARRNDGYDRHNVLTFQVGLPESKYREEKQVRAFYGQLVERLAALPGAEAAAAQSSLPGGFSYNRPEYAAEGQPPAAPGEFRLAVSGVVSPEYFRVLRIPLLEGRLITSQDGPDSTRVVVMSARLASRLWPGQSPLGKRVHFGSTVSGAPWHTVVGAVGDIKLAPWEPEVAPIVYFPLAQSNERSLSLAIRTTGDPLALVAAARAQVQALDSDQPVYDVRSLERIIADEMSGVKASADIMMTYAVIALVLSASGIFALMAYSVSQRQHEIGVRMTLGARPADVFRLVISQALRLTLAGLAIGVPAALALMRTLSSVLLGVIQIDAPVFAGMTLSLAAVAALAAYIPARGATRVDPVVALRHE